MNYKKMYAELKDIYQSEYKDLKILKLLNGLEELTRKEASKEGGGLKRYTSAKKVLKNKVNKSRPILQKSIIRDNMQIFTDTYQLYILKNHIKELETHDEEASERYPEIKHIIPDVTAYIEIDCSELKKDLSIIGKGEFYNLKNEDIHAKLDPTILKNMIAILQFKNTDIIKFGYIKKAGYQEVYKHPFKIIKNDDVAIVLPIRFEPEEETK